MASPIITTIPKLPGKITAPKVGLSDPIEDALRGLDLTETSNHDKRLRTLIPPAKAEEIESRISDSIGEIYKIFTDKSVLLVTVHILMCNGAMISVVFRGKHYSSSEFTVDPPLKALLLPVVFRSFEENKAMYTMRSFCNAEIQFKLNDDLQLEYEVFYTPFIPDKVSSHKVKIFDPGLAEDL